MRPAIALRRGWWRRGTGAAVIAGVGWLVLWWMDFGPRPLTWTLLVVLACTVVWLVLDTVDTSETTWAAPSRIQEDAPEVTSSHHRIVASHLVSANPDSALRDRLVALARLRDPELLDAELSDPELRDLALSPPRRLRPAEIDHLLTRIEALRDRT